MTIFTELLLIATVSFLVGYPLFSKRPRSAKRIKTFDPDGLPHLLVQKEVAYATLKDLDFDFKTGKLSDEDYRELKGQYKREAIEILEKIDKISQKQSRPAGKNKKKKIK